MCNIPGKLDDPGMAMVELMNNGKLLFYSILSILSIMIFNVTGLYLTKKVSSIFRIIIDSIRTISVWILSIFWGFEHFFWKAFLIQALGFILLIIGNLVYNEIIEVKVFGFHK